VPDLDDWQADALDAFAGVAEAEGWTWWICGSAALRLHGFDRAAHDLDVTLVDPGDLAPLLALAESRGWWSAWARDGAGAAISALLRPAPRCDLDVFLIPNDATARRWAAGVVRIGGRPVHSLDRAAELKRAWAVQDRSWAKHTADLAAIEARTAGPESLWAD
jgi:hypothetical protein